MSKGLEALERMKENSYYVDDKNLKEDVGILEQALLELKQIKEAESSEAMESLERIDKEYATIENEDFKICFNTIKQALLNAQELEKENQELIKKADCCLWKDCNKISQENQELKCKYEIYDFYIKMRYQKMAL